MLQQQQPQQQQQQQRQLRLPIAARRASGSTARNPQQAYETVIFLDVDGVLHSLYGEDLFREGCCGLLVRIVQATGASLVLSSTWRTDPAKVAFLNETLRRWNLASVVEFTKSLDCAREGEICEWLDRHPQVLRWIAIDDMDLQSGRTWQASRMQGHFVRTNPSTGLLPQDAELAIQLLVAQGAAPAPATPSTVKSAASPSPLAARSPLTGRSPVPYGSPMAQSRWASPAHWSPASAARGLQSPPHTPAAHEFRSPLASPTPLRTCASPYHRLPVAVASAASPQKSLRSASTMPPAPAGAASPSLAAAAALVAAAQVAGPASGCSTARLALAGIDRAARAAEGPNNYFPGSPTRRPLAAAAAAATASPSPQHRQQHQLSPSHLASGAGVPARASLSQLSCKASSKACLFVNVHEPTRFSA